MRKDLKPVGEKPIEGGETERTRRRGGTRRRT